MSKYSLIPHDVEDVSTQYRTITTQIPSVSSVPLLQEMLEYEPLSMQGQPPIIIDKAQGFQVYDESGNMWLDFSSGVLINNVGHGDSHIIDALDEVIHRPLLSTYVFPHRARITLSKMLCETVAFPNYKVFLMSTGSEATENCIKLAKTYGLLKGGHKKKYFVSFENAFHGRTLGAQLAGGMERAKAWIGDLDPTFVQVPFPDGYRTKDLSFDLFLTKLSEKGIKGEEVCGVMSESYQGVGPHFFPKEYAKRLEVWCKKYDVVLIMDEVQSGFCRTGKWYTYEHYDIQPDLVACGKGISGSLPLSAVIGREDIMNLYAPGSMTSTHSGSPLPVVAAIANIKELRNGSYLENAKNLGSILTASLEKLQRRYPETIYHTSSLGLVGGLQIVDPDTNKPDPDTAIKINEACFRKGLLMFAPVGVAGECIKIAPPLCITKEALLEGLDVLEKVCEEILG